MHERDRRPQHGSTPQTGQTDRRAVPAAIGKYTLLDTLPAPMPLSPPRQPPPHTRSDEVLVSLYGSGTKDIDRKNDCGPSCALMVIRVLGLEDELKQRVTKWPSRKPSAVTVGEELSEIRNMYFGKHDDQTMAASDVQRILSVVLPRLGDVDSPEMQAALKQVMPLFSAQNAGTHKIAEDTATPTTPADAAKAFLERHCTPSSAVIVYGRPTPKAWGWGGKEDKDNARPVSDVNEDGVPGDHIVFVWRLPNQETFDVLDPAWTKPRRNITVDKIMNFIAAAGKAIDMFAVPFADVTKQLGAPMTGHGTATQTSPPTTSQPPTPAATHAAPTG